MKTDIGFPPVGILAKFLFSSTGLLAEKDARKDPRFSDAERKKYQKTLDRLVTEEGQFADNFDQILDVFRKQLKTIIPSKRIANAMLCSVNEVYVQYRHLINEEGTYFSQKETLKWALETRFIGRMILSPQKNYLRFNIKDESWKTPNDPFWYLPTVKADGITWPLQKALEFGQEVAKTSLTNFHYPGDGGAQENYQLKQNEANARNWLKGQHIPSWHGLNMNLRQSFDALQSCTSKHHRKLSEKEKSSVLIVAFIARFSTYVCQEIAKAFGREFLSSLIERYKIYTEHLSQDHSEIEEYVDSEIAKALQNRNFSNGLRDELLWTSVPSYWAYKANIGTEYVKSLEQRRQIETRLNQPYTVEEQKGIIHNCGNFQGRMLIESPCLQVKYPPPEGFFDELHEAEQLRKTREIKKDTIQTFEQRLKQKSLTEALGWYANWLYGIMYYRQQSYAKAYLYYGKAFEQAKYSAGNRQYPLVNTYIELCAKRKQKKAFRKAVSWAHYIGMRVRWIESVPPQEDELEVAYAFFESAFYPQT
ncbi:hypothetical protein [Amphritea sp.]|uniref:hypothetical protein n=1 Tax=Amphritea sp. TaxID=1872502 RepID=UPI003D0B1C60